MEKLYNPTIDTLSFTVFNEDMAKSRALTTSNIVSVLKKAGFATKKDVKEIVEDTVFEKLSEFHTNMTVPALNKFEERLTLKIESTEHNLTQEIDGLKTEFSESPSKIEFEKLKKTVASL